MSYKVSALKWRPNSFEEVIGQNHITKALKNAIQFNRISHAFTFSGPRGVGKTTTARILAKEVNQVDNINSSFDIIEMDAASNRGIDEIRNLRESVNIAPAHGKYKIYIIDEVHMLTKEAFNALLKTLEEPPSYVIFVLATTDPYKMPATILSSTLRYDFRRLSVNNIIQQLRIILAAENINFHVDTSFNNNSSELYIKIDTLDKLANRQYFIGKISVIIQSEKPYADTILWKEMHFINSKESLKEKILERAIDIKKGELYCSKSSDSSIIYRSGRNRMTISYLI